MKNTLNYESVSAAANALGVTKDTIKKNCVRSPNGRISMTFVTNDDNIYTTNDQTKDQIQYVKEAIEIRLEMADTLLDAYRSHGYTYYKEQDAVNEAKDIINSWTK